MDAEGANVSHGGEDNVCVLAAIGDERAVGEAAGQACPGKQLIENSPDLCSKNLPLSHVNERRIFPFYCRVGARFGRRWQKLNCAVRRNNSSVEGCEVEKEQPPRRGSREQAEAGFV